VPDVDDHNFIRGGIGPVEDQIGVLSNRQNTDASTLRLPADARKIPKTFDRLIRTTTSTDTFGLRSAM
jgi:hypothetical protein